MRQELNRELGLDPRALGSCGRVGLARCLPEIALGSQGGGAWGRLSFKELDGQEREEGVTPSQFSLSSRERGTCEESEAIVE